MASVWGNIFIWIYTYMHSRKFVSNQAPWEPSVSSMGHLGNLFVRTDIYKYAHV